MRLCLSLTLLALSILGCNGLPAETQEPAQRPNLILIVADDLGYGDLGSYGQEKIQTPHLDRLAAEGVRFTDFYSGSPVCAPSRCMLLTGKHGGHAYVRDNWEAGGWNEGDAEGQMPLLPNTPGLGRSLQEAGYATACIGKWGLGGPGSTGAPEKQGFDHFYGYLCQRQAHNFYPTHLWRDGVKEELEGNVWKNLSGRHYAHDLMTADALSWVEQQGEEPFFLLLTYTIPHLALQVPEDAMEPYYGQWEETAYDGKKGYLPHPTPRAAYAGMVSRMDRDVGRLMAQLQAQGIDENTLVVFTSDNGATFDIGGADTPFFQSNAHLRGHKGSVYEGGIRVPMIARWPQELPQGATSSTVGAFWDLMPTLLDAAAVALPSETDGDSLLAAMRRPQEPLEGRSLYWEFPGYGGQQALREGPWMLLRRGLRKGEPSVELYHLENDPSQETNVAAEHPERVAKMLARMAEEHEPSAEFPLPGVDS